MQQSGRADASGGLNVLCFETAAQAEREAAMLMREHMATGGDSVVGLATGRTMLPVYAWLRQWHQDGVLSFRGVTTFNLDEYCGMQRDDPASFTSYMRRHLFDHVDIAADRFHFPDELVPDRFDDLIRARGGIGLQLLGIGRNGHIGFNEPGASLESRTRIVTLAESTRTANAVDFPEGTMTPAKAVTMGIATILAARRIVLLATGGEKAETLRRAQQGPITADCPASYLQLHGNVTVICDSAVAARLKDPT